MRHAKPIFLRPPVEITVVITVLILALLACTASLDGGSGGSGGGANNAGEGGEGSTAPTVRILEPASGTQVATNQRVDIVVETDTTATSFLLNVGGRVASSKALPSGQSGPTKAILSWTPDRQGTFSLEVIAFNGAAASLPAALLLEVSGTASATTPGQAGACTGRVLVSQLNFRDGPGTNYTQLGQFDVGETVTVIGRNAIGSWYKVQRINAQQVWTINNVDWIQFEGDCTGVAVVG
jgi:hypothetical protein